MHKKNVYSRLVNKKSSACGKLSEKDIQKLTFHVKSESTRLQKQQQQQQHGTVLCTTILFSSHCPEGF